MSRASHLRPVASPRPGEPGPSPRAIAADPPPPFRSLHFPSPLATRLTRRGLETRGHRPQNALIARREDAPDQVEGPGVQPHHHAALLLMDRLQDAPCRAMGTGDGDP